MTPQSRIDLGGDRMMGNTGSSYSQSREEEPSLENVGRGGGERRLTEVEMMIEGRDSRNDSILQMFANQQENELLQQQVDTLR